MHLRHCNVSTVRREKSPREHQVRSLGATSAGTQKRAAGNTELISYECLVEVARAEMQQCAPFAFVDRQRGQAAARAILPFVGAKDKRLHIGLTDPCR